MDQKPEQIMRDDPRSSNDNRERIPVATVRGPTVPKKVSFSEKLREARPSKKIVAVLMVATAVLTMIVGFNWGGWVTGGHFLPQPSRCLGPAPFQQEGM